MRSKHFLAFVAASLSVAAFGTGCGSDDSGTGGAGTTTTSASTTAATTTSADATSTSDTSSVTTTTSTGPVDDGNNSFDTAEQLDVDSGIQAELDTPDKDVDYYKFTGTAGQALAFLTDAKPDDDPFADGYMDLVITVYDEAKAQIAQNDDPFPRDTQDSAVYTVLPADGTYYVKVEEFCESDLSAGGCPGDYFDNIFENAYAINLVTIDSTNFPSFTAHDETLDANPATSTPMLYTPVDAADPMQGYYRTVVQAAFDMAGDSDFYVVDFPDGLEGLFDPLYSVVSTVATYPGGSAGNGSTSEVGKLTLWNSDASMVIAQIDASLLDGNNFPPDLAPPVTLGSTYILQVERASGGGNNDFYFVNHGGTQYSNQPEVETTNENDTTPEVLDSPDGGVSYFVTGTLLSNPAANQDKADLFAFDVSDSTLLVTVSCGAQRSGSGLRGFSFELLEKDGTPVAGSQSPVEDAATDINIVDFALPVGGTYHLALTAVSQDATVTSNFYRCGISISP